MDTVKNKYMPSKEKIERMLYYVRFVDTDRISSADMERIRRLKELLSADRLRFDAFPTIGCPDHFDPHCVRLCSCSLQESEDSCVRCWLVNLSSELKTEERKEAVIEHMLLDEKNYRLLYEYQETRMTPGMMRQLLKKLKWDSFAGFDEFYKHICKEEDKKDG